MPRKVDHAHRRDELAALIVRLVEAEGAAAATFRRIAEAGAFSIGVLTHYFRDKDEMIATAFDWLARQSFASLDARLAATAPGRAQLRAVLAFMVPARGEVTYPGVWLALWSASRHNDALARVHREYYGHWRRRVRQALAQSGQAGSAARDTLDLLVQGIDGLWLGVVLEPSRYPPRRRTQLVDALLAAVLDGASGTVATAPAVQGIVPPRRPRGARLP